MLKKNDVFVPKHVVVNWFHEIGKDRSIRRADENLRGMSGVNARSERQHIDYERAT
jgi:hypothetical protein